jgi:hypothetical protein
MMYEITQIKQWLIDNLGLRGEGEGWMLRVVDPVPDGEYVIPLGVSLTPTKVTIKDNQIHIGEDVGPPGVVPTEDIVDAPPGA